VRFKAMLSVFLDSDAQATAFSAGLNALEALFYIEVKIIKKSVDKYLKY
jgi:hypothetical protein